jgi:transposase InsO family protein
VSIYPFIEAEKACRRNVKRACELLKVSRAAFYQYLAGPSPREEADAELAAQIQSVHAGSKGRYGAPRVHAELRRRGRAHSRKRVARIMRASGLQGKAAKRWKKTTIADPAAAARADKIRRDFTADASKLNTRWCGDITYLATWEGWLYLATVIDIASRRVVGFALADHLRTELIADALTNAVAARDPAPGVIFHSDRGCQYTSAQFAALAGDCQVDLSVGRTGQCWDNALSESFFASIKGELLDLQAWPTRATARRAIVEYIGWFGYAGDLGVSGGGLAVRRGSCVREACGVCSVCDPRAAAWRRGGVAAGS